MIPELDSRLPREMVKHEDSSYASEEDSDGDLYPNLIPDDELITLTMEEILKAFRLSEDGDNHRQLDRFTEEIAALRTKGRAASAIK